MPAFATFDIVTMDLPIPHLDDYHLPDCLQFLDFSVADSILQECTESPTSAATTPTDVLQFFSLPEPIAHSTHLDEPNINNSAKEV